MDVLSALYRYYSIAWYENTELLQVMRRAIVRKQLCCPGCRTGVSSPELGCVEAPVSMEEIFLFSNLWNTEEDSLPFPENEINFLFDQINRVNDGVINPSRFFRKGGFDLANLKFSFFNLQFSMDFYVL